MRINKYIASCGVASRRKAEELIISGRVTINGELVTDLSTKIDETKDIVEVDGKVINQEEKKVYLLLNKPEGYITTVKDQFDRPSVLDILKDIEERVYPVGRLDYETSGLLILTNDGELTYKLTHPKHEVEKTYLASVNGIFTPEEKRNFENGLKIEDYTTAKAKLKIIKTDVEKNYSVCKITIHEGKNRQVRKMCKAVGHPVRNLRRIQMGRINIRGLEIGEYRNLTEDEVKYLKSLK
ncbi:pseudouridine synthase [Peptacetobacter sp.]|uniref:pseudouridine synthase n=1 Tax=Peptacetobacter sp. TaxID=2991975 RepID=UPI00261A09FA|nr:pseudouridine synthase [Peptacetobacter sp.]